jgi:hypothetical protein
LIQLLFGLPYSAAVAIELADLGASVLRDFS